MPKSYNISNLEDFLVEYGLTPKQARIYLASLRLGPSPTQAIATEAKTERTNAYDAIETLVAKGLMSISTQGKKRLFVAEQPETLETILKERQAALVEVIPQIRSLAVTTEHKPRVRFYPGIDGYKSVYEDTLNTREGKLFGIFSVENIWDVLGRDYADRMVARRIKKGISLRVIRRRGEAANVYPSNEKDLREMRRAPEGVIFPITTYVYDNKVVILSSKKELFGLLIESEDIATAHRHYFEALWQISTPG